MAAPVSDDDDKSWSPDMHLVERVRTTGASIGDMTPIDRAWVVVVLSSMGWTAQEIADRMHCSLRLIRSIKAENITRVLTYVHDLRTRFMIDHAASRIEVANSARLTDASIENAVTLRRQRDELIVQLRVERAAHTPKDVAVLHPCSVCGDCLLTGAGGRAAFEANLERGSHAFCAWAGAADWRAITGHAGPGGMFGSPDERDL